MPGGDRTGPMGLGPMTGRAAGFCAGYGVPGYMNPIPGGGGWGWGRGRRGGWGWRNWFNATGMPGWQRAAMGMPAWGGSPAGAPVGAPAPTPKAERQFLAQQVDALQQQLDAARKRLDELAEQEDA